MDTSLKVVAGVALTALLLGVIGTVTVRRRIGLIAAIPTAAAWAIAADC